MISIITINFNNARGLERTLNSISEQSYKKFELILVDGKSTDDFKNVVKNYENIITKMISEPDRGISHAFNKGINMSKGDWLLFLNSGDYLFDRNTLYNIACELDTNYDFIQCNVQVTDSNLQPLYIIPKYKGSKTHSMAHQGLLHNRNFFLKAGYFSESYKIAMDTDIEIRLKNVKTKYCDIILSCMPNDGVSAKNIKRVLREDMACHLLNLNDKSVISIFLLYHWRLIKWFIKKIIKKG